MYHFAYHVAVHVIALYCICLYVLYMRIQLGGVEKKLFIINIIIIIIIIYIYIYILQPQVSNN